MNTDRAVHPMACEASYYRTVSRNALGIYNLILRRSSTSCKMNWASLCKKRNWMFEKFYHSLGYFHVNYIYFDILLVPIYDEYTNDIRFGEQYTTLNILFSIELLPSN